MTAGPVMMRPVLDAIAAALDAAAQGSHGSVVVLHGRDLRVADVLDDLPRVEVLAGGFDVAGARGDFVASTGERIDDPDALLALLRERLETGRTVVLALDDVDRALPPVRWHDDFLRRSLPELVREHRLVVLAGVSVLDVLPPLDATVVAVPGPAADVGAAETQLHALFEHLGGETATKGYDLAVRTLQVAALEGTVFTVAALARVQGEDEDLLTDWLDDYLAVDGGPLEDLGFVDGKERPLARYGFRDRAFWSAMRADVGRRVPRRYSEALAEVYGHAPEAVFRIWSLAGEVSTDEYVRVANAFATEHDHLRLLEAETERRARSGQRGALDGVPAGGRVHDRAATTCCGTRGRSSSARMSARRSFTTCSASSPRASSGSATPRAARRSRSSSPRSRFPWCSGASGSPARCSTSPAGSPAASRAWGSRSRGSTRSSTTPTR